MSSGLDRCISCKKLLNQCICKDRYEKFMDKSIENYSKCGIYSEKEIFGKDCDVKIMEDKFTISKPIDYSKKHPKLYMMIGMPGSGKSTYIQKYLPNIPVLCKDMMRLDIFRQEYDQANEIHISRISKYLSDILADSRISFILDETNIKSMRREKIIEIYKDRMYIIGIWIHTSFKKCKERRLHFPEGVMEQKWEEFESPTMDENFNELIEIENIDNTYIQRSKIVI